MQIIYLQILIFILITRYQFVKDHIYSKNNLFFDKDKIYQIVKFRLMIYLFRKKLAIKIISLVYFDLILLVIKHPLISVKFIINMINKKK